ncbi:NCS1 family nucleobase:cation symporter-1 [[Emmonsia] crescens]|uniref:NCS1 family nucleobase:cation symporter-1 n=1 Tax=[Emmonsia] crescens TaxID=73230 RepID=A0A0G2ICJ9_9EURO|nr:NCS1 family nucleobase:cation symporter-1 [Emmonsia crescens UAMH 3008]
MESSSISKIAHYVSKLEVKYEVGLSAGQLMLVNNDLKPVKPEHRQWGPWNYVGFWIADSFNINTWMISSAMIVEGLSWWQSWICVWLGYFIAAVFLCLSARIGAVYHISFPVGIRASFGVWGSMWPVFNRAAMACIWYGVQSWIGGTTTKDFLSFFLFSLCSLPAIWFPVHKIRHLFTVKSYYAPIAGIVFLAWSIRRAGGLGPIVDQQHTVQGSKLAWAVIKGVMSAIANFATLIVNSLDFSRVARKPKDALYSQLFTIPISFAITSFIGIIVSSSSGVLYGEPIWNPLDLLGKFLDGASKGERFGVFIISSAFALAQLGTNIAANSISAGTDMTALFPRFLSIRRGGYICATVGFAMCPWHLLSSSNSFTTYLSAYSVFLSSIAGPMICDYYLVRKGYIEVKELYSTRKYSPYYYTFGFSWHAYASYFSGILINIIGFIGAVGINVPIVATYLYNLNFFCGFIVSFVMYYILTRVWPIPATSKTWNEMDIDVTDLSVAYNQGEAISIDEESQSRSPSSVVGDEREVSVKGGKARNDFKGVGGDF